MGTSLVPYTEYRHQAEVLEGIPNLYHDSLLSPEDARNINSSINIVGYAADHGVAGLYKTSQREFQAAFNLVSSLDPERGDKLFIEESGHEGTPVAQEDLERYAGNPELYSRLVEEFRQKGSIDMGNYAAILAAIRGIPVVYADMDVTQKQSLEHVMDKTELSLLLKKPKHWQALAFRRLREQQAANTVKDHALAALPSIDPEHKPTYALLFGRHHYDQQEPSNIPKVFSDLGLNIQVVELSRTSRSRIALDAAKMVLRAIVHRKSLSGIVEHSYKS
ncbi:MAG TPA: hypothetical protein VLF69_06130 [Candidatus Saccharimonadales bacterium]|nr:hypothetical protein [Candidatus Saccharimonadales bacterium]